MIRIITVGKISKPFREIFDHYSKMVSRFTRLEHIALPTGGDLGKVDHTTLKRREARRIREKIRGRFVLLDERGGMMDSEEFAEFLEGLGREVTFVVGGPLGVDESLRREADHVLSLSKMTLSHEIAFAVLLEQIFRAFKISRGERYHY